MSRRIVAFLLILVLLICPYLCLGEAALATAAPLHTVGCSCCDLPTESSDKAPERPTEDEPDCLCHGAIVDASRVETQSISANAPVLPLLARAVGPQFGSQLSILDSLPLFSHFPPLCSGRDLCIWCALLLI